MNSGTFSPIVTYLASIILFVTFVFTGGCEKKSSNPATPPDASVVILSAKDLKPDGSLNAAGLEKVQAKSSVPNVTVAFFRDPLSDAGLEQLSKFPNIHRIEAVGSRITPQGIEKLKAANPSVEVAR